MRSLTLLVALSLAAPEAEAQGTDASRFGFRIQGGLVVPVGIDSVDPPGGPEFTPKLALSVAVGYHLHPRLALEVATGVSYVEAVEEMAGSSYDVNFTEFRWTMVPLTLGLRADLRTSSGGGLWATAGLGAFRSSVVGRLRPDGHLGAVLSEDPEIAFGGYAGLAYEGRVGPRTHLGIELRYVMTTTSFEQLDYSGNGVQILGGLTYQFGAGSATATARSAPAPASPPAPGEPGAPAQPAPSGSAARWRFLARVGGFFPTSNDLDVLGNGLEGEIGVARSFASRLDGELAIGYFGANARESASLPQLIVVPVTVSARMFQPLGADFEASAYAGVGVYVANFKLSSARDHLSVAPGLHVGVALATRVWGEGSIGLDARLLATTAKVGGADTQDVHVAGARVGATVAVPF